MAQTVKPTTSAAATGTTAPAAGTAATRRTEATNWVGFVAFAGIMMILVGAMHALSGLIAILNDQWIVFGNTGNLLLDLTTWGWIHLVAGILVAVVGAGVIVGNTAARVAGVIVAGLSMLANFLFLPAYPVWGVVMITIDALVIYALMVHGREIRLD